MAYVKENWVDVKDPANPPDGAPMLNAATLDKIEQGIVDAHTANLENSTEIENCLGELEKSFGIIKSADDKNELYSFKPYSNYYFSKIVAENCNVAISPNGRFFAVKKASETAVRLYKTDDWSEVGSISVFHEGSCRIDMDNNFGLVCGSNSSINFFKYDEESIMSLGNPSGIDIGSTDLGKQYTSFAQGQTDSAIYFWFLTNKGLYRMSKSDYSTILVTQPSNFSRMYRDGDGVILETHRVDRMNKYSNSSQTYYVPAGFTMSVVKVSAEGSTTPLFTKNHDGDCNGASFPSPDVSIYDPAMNKVVIGGSATYVSNGIQHRKLMHIYNMDGTLAYSSQNVAPSSNATNGSDVNYINSYTDYFIRDGVLVYVRNTTNAEAYDLNTLNFLNESSTPTTDVFGVPNTNNVNLPVVCSQPSFPLCKGVRGRLYNYNGTSYLSIVALGVDIHTLGGWVKNE